MGKILAFGIAKEIIGGTITEIAFPDATTVENLKAIIEEQYPGLKQLAKFMIAVNGEYAQPRQLLKQTDEIAIIPPVSGG